MLRELMLREAEEEKQEGGEEGSDVLRELMC
jgi:hypothetical protein